MRMIDIWCRHIFRESNKAADTHANWLMDNVILDLERSGRRLISTTKCISNVIFYCLSMGPGGGADWVRLLVVMGRIRIFRESLLWWTCGEECFSDYC